MPHFERHVFVCTNERAPGHPRGDCKSKGGVELRDALKKALNGRGLGTLIRPNNAGCLDQCEAGCTVVVYPEQVWYGGVTLADLPEIVESHLIGGVPVARLLMADQPHVDPARVLPVIAVPLATIGLSRPR